MPFALKLGLLAVLSVPLLLLFGESSVPQTLTIEACLVLGTFAVSVLTLGLALAARRR